MRATSLGILRCPACTGTLALEQGASHGGLVSEGFLVCAACGVSYPVVEGIPNLVHPPRQEYFEENVERYADVMAFQERFLVDDERKVRARVAALTEAKPGDRVLEVACGPGPNFPQLLDRIGTKGELFALDISPAQLRAAAKAASAAPPVELLLANGSWLPFADASFDALLHVGTLNRFPDVTRALAEMARVVRPGGKVVAADEGLAPWLRETDYGRLLARFGDLFRGDVPIERLPERAEEVCVRWLFGRTYYVVDFRVGNAPAPNLDAKLPGLDTTVREAIGAAKAGS